MKRIIVLSLVILSIAGCNRIQGGLGAIGIGSGSAKRAKVEIDGTQFKAKADANREDSRSFTISVTPVAVNPDGAKAAGRYEATRYCLLTYGGSDTDWVIGPDTPLEDIPVEGDTMTLQGRCTQR